MMADRTRTANQDEALLALAARLAASASELIMEIRRAGFETRRKADSSPVTEADHRAEALILAGLRAGASIPAIAEEESAAGLVVAAGQEFWLVDPLDGTRGFARGDEEFTVNIGLVRDGRAVLGAVALPAYGQLYLGHVGHGAIRRHRSGETAIRARLPPREGLSVLISRHRADDPRLVSCLAGLRVAHTRDIGSAVKFIRVAEGEADFHPRFGRTMEWDTAAPQAVVEAAGGSVRLMDGSPLRYGKPRWENPDFIVRGRLAEAADR